MLDSNPAKVWRLPTSALAASLLIIWSRMTAADEPSAMTVTPAIATNNVNCEAFLTCETEMMIAHQRCTQNSRNAAIQLCGLVDQFSALSRLMGDRMAEFRDCVRSPGIDESLLEIENIANCAVLPAKPLVQPAAACWRAVSLLREHCTVLSRCCPAGNVCTKRLRDSALTLALRDVHVEINRKTLECRNQVRDNLAQRRNASDDRFTARVHAVEMAQRENSVDLIGPLSSSTTKAANDEPLRVYAAPRAKLFPEDTAPDFRAEFAATGGGPSPATDVLVPFSAPDQVPDPMGLAAPMRVRQLKRFRNGARHEVNTDLAAKATVTAGPKIVTPSIPPVTSFGSGKMVSDFGNGIVQNDGEDEIAVTETVNAAVTTTTPAIKSSTTIMTTVDTTVVPTTTTVASLPSTIPSATPISTETATVATLPTKGYVAQKTVLKTVSGGRLGGKKVPTTRTPIVEYVYKAALLRRRHQNARARLREQKQRAAVQHAVAQSRADARLPPPAPETTVAFAKNEKDTKSATVDAKSRPENESDKSASGFVDLGKLLEERDAAVSGVMRVKEVAPATTVAANSSSDSANRSGLFSVQMSNGRRAVKTSLNQIFPEAEMVSVLRQLRDRNNVYVARRRQFAARAGTPLRNLPARQLGQRTQISALPAGEKFVPAADAVKHGFIAAPLAANVERDGAGAYVSQARVNTSALLRSFRRFEAARARERNAVTVSTNDTTITSGSVSTTAQIPTTVSKKSDVDPTTNIATIAMTTMDDKSMDSNSEMKSAKMSGTGISNVSKSFEFVSSSRMQQTTDNSESMGSTGITEMESTGTESNSARTISTVNSNVVPDLIETSTAKWDQSTGSSRPQSDHGSIQVAGSRQIGANGDNSAGRRMQVELRPATDGLNVEHNGVFEQHFEGDVRDALIAALKPSEKLEGVKTETAISAIRGEKNAPADSKNTDAEKVASNEPDRASKVLSAEFNANSDSQFGSHVQKISKETNVTNGTNKKISTSIDSVLGSGKVNGANRSGPGGPNNSANPAPKTEEEDDDGPLFPARSSAATVPDGDARQQPYPKTTTPTWWPAPRGRFQESAAGADAVPALFSNAQAEAHALPQTGRYNLTRLAAARPALARLLRDRERLAQKLRRFLAKGRVNAFGREVKSKPGAEPKRGRIESKRARAFGAALTARNPLNLAGDGEISSPARRPASGATEWSADGALIPFWRSSTELGTTPAPSTETTAADNNHSGEIVITRRVQTPMPVVPRRTMTPVRDWRSTTTNAPPTLSFEESLFGAFDVVATTALPVIDSDSVGGPSASEAPNFQISNEIRRYPARKIPPPFVAVDGSSQRDETETRRPAYPESASPGDSTGLRHVKIIAEKPQELDQNSQSRVELEIVRQPQGDPQEHYLNVPVRVEPKTARQQPQEVLVKGEDPFSTPKGLAGAGESSRLTLAPLQEEQVEAADLCNSSTATVATTTVTTTVEPQIETTISEIETTQGSTTVIVVDPWEKPAMESATLSVFLSDQNTGDGSELFDETTTTTTTISPNPTDFAEFLTIRPEFEASDIVRPVQETPTLSTVAPESNSAFRTDTPDVSASSGPNSGGDPFAGVSAASEEPIETQTQDHMESTTTPNSEIEASDVTGPVFPALHLKHSPAIRIRPLNSTVEMNVGGSSTAGPSSAASLLNSAAMDAISAVLSRKQLQRIVASIASASDETTRRNRLIGYRNKVLYARRQLAAAEAARRTATTEENQQATIATANTNDADFSAAVMDFSGIGESLKNRQLETEIRRAPRIHSNIPPPPGTGRSASSEKGKDESDLLEELLAAKRALILNLEKFLRTRKEENRLRTENENENERLTALRRPRQDYDERGQLTGYCELYSTCADQLKFVQRKCGEAVGGESATGRLIPGLPKRRFGSCNAKLLGHYQRVDTVRAELEESVENCLVEKIATRDSQVSASCPSDWPLLPAFETQSTCAERIAVIQNHCKKLARCCTSLETCQQNVENFALARRLRLEEERLSLRAAECQVNAHDKYRQLRQRVQQEESNPSVQQNDFLTTTPTYDGPAQTTPIPYSSLDTRTLERQISELSELEPFHGPVALRRANAPTTRVQSDPITLADERNGSLSALLLIDDVVQTVPATFSSVQQSPVLADPAGGWSLSQPEQQKQPSPPRQEDVQVQQQQLLPQWWEQQQKSSRDPQPAQSWEPTPEGQQQSSQGPSYIQQQQSWEQQLETSNQRQSDQQPQSLKWSQLQTQARQRRQNAHRQEQKRRAVWRNKAKRRRRLLLL